MSNKTSETNIINEITIKRGRGRPKGTGNIQITLGELMERLGNDKDALVPVKHLWWSGSTSESSVPQDIQDQLEKEESKIEFTIG